ncbi:hypothetical protein [Cnuibacter physcomitrellae]|uniref:hypothetical protein n=1 Tax=Cnuibacter physcomitrellae TaxID=1619308 RepID=UPI0012F49776|nr:hypothetical protein [Cnuibacter physcomitrellae]MCS5496299.1 hypothetical protein [Cnuibacter physcomitrellae]
MATAEGLLMIGWRRRARAAREAAVSRERLYELVSQTLMENFGPLGSFAITRRSGADTDDIFHTVLAASVARDIVVNLTEHNIVMQLDPTGKGSAAPALAPVDRVPLPRPVAHLVPVDLPAAGSSPAAAADPRDDDALRALVAHHAEVTEAAERHRTETAGSASA